MRASPVVMCCWPGLPRLWLRGDWLALGIALAFGVALNLLLASTVVRPDWLPEIVPVVGWFALGGGWLACVVRAHRNLPQLRQPVSAADNRGLFLQAQGEYLQGHWYEAELLLLQLLRQSLRDVDARLMLATLYRRARRYEEAGEELSQLEKLDGAEKWQWEMVAERQLLKQAMAKTTVDSAAKNSDKT